MKLSAAAVAIGACGALVALVPLLCSPSRRRSDGDIIGSQDQEIASARTTAAVQPPPRTTRQELKPPQFLVDNLGGKPMPENAFEDGRTNRRAAFIAEHQLSQEQSNELDDIIADFNTDYRTVIAAIDFKNATDKKQVVLQGLLNRASAMQRSVSRIAGLKPGLDEHSIRVFIGTQMDWQTVMEVAAQAKESEEELEQLRLEGATTKGL
jgi:hypothetical protein